jgi:acetylornithine deacetylase/succinyl-diaminopimelate desuccinylase-like protein
MKTANLWPFRAGLLASFLAVSACGEDPAPAASSATVPAQAAPAPVVASSPPASDEGLAPHQTRARALLRELIEIDTTHSTGSTTLAAEAMARHLLAAGFPRADVQVLEEVPRKGNLVARYRGRDAGTKPLLLLAHLDVVEANPADWTVDPFKFLERDGYFYGRGSVDDKDEAAIHIANLIRMREEGFVPDRDIVVALTADEEAGPNNGVAWLLANHRELIDAEFVVNEGGGGSFQNGRRLSNDVQVSEKVFQTFKLEVTDPGGHSSMPRAENPIYRLAEALTRIGDHVFPVNLNEVTRVFFERTAAISDPTLAAAMLGMLEQPPDPAAVEHLSAIPAYNARIRTTCVATMLEAGHAQNALPQRASATVNCRILPGELPAEIEATLTALIADPRISVTAMNAAQPSSPSPLTPAVLDPIERITAELWPGVPVIPTMNPGATDGLYLRNAGIPVYGVSGIFRDIDDNRAHGRDERMLVSWFFEGQEFLYRLTTALATTEGR